MSLPPRNANSRVSATFVQDIVMESHNNSATVGPFNRLRCDSRRRPATRWCRFALRSALIEFILLQTHHTFSNFNMLVRNHVTPRRFAGAVNRNWAWTSPREQLSNILAARGHDDYQCRKDAVYLLGASNQRHTSLRRYVGSHQGKASGFATHIGNRLVRQFQHNGFQIETQFSFVCWPAEEQVFGLCEEARVCLEFSGGLAVKFPGQDQWALGGRCLDGPGKLGKSTQRRGDYQRNSLPSRLRPSGFCTRKLLTRKLVRKFLGFGSVTTHRSSNCLVFVHGCAGWPWRAKD